LPVDIRIVGSTCGDISHKIIIYTNADKDFSLVGHIVGKVDIPIQNDQIKYDSNIIESLP
jgi:hypothetical protein